MRDKLLEKARDLLNEILAALAEPIPAETKAQQTSGTELDLIKGLLESSEWPEAVFGTQIADDKSEIDKKERAEGISDILLPPFGGKKFLDFGCGEGHVAKHVSGEAAFSVGYDAQKSPASQLGWEDKKDNLLLTTDFAKVIAEGPYNIILIYDVLDHSSESPAEVLLKAKSVLAEDGRIILRCHPWTSRHGGHAYRQINKAFVHLVLTDEEMKHMGLHIEPNRKISSPLREYGAAIEAAGLEKVSEAELDTQEVEPFFEENPLIRQRILKSLGAAEWKTEYPAFQMSQCFVDYILKKMGP